MTSPPHPAPPRHTSGGPNGCPACPQFPKATYPIALHQHTVVDGGDIVGVMQADGEPVRIPAWTLVGNRLILGAHPSDGLPPDVDVIVNVDSFRWYDVPKDVLYIHHAGIEDEDVLPDMTTMHRLADFVNDMRSAGKTVLVHCRLGLNRSGLLVALAMIHEGYNPSDVLWILRATRDPYVLCNKTFEEYLLSPECRQRARY